MQVNKAQLLRFLQERGMVGIAERIERDLPDQIDTETYGEQLEEFGIDVAQLRRAAAGAGGDPGS